MRRRGRDIRQRGLRLGGSKQPAAHGWACDQRQREAAGEVLRLLIKLVFPLPLSEKVAAGLGCQMDSAQAGTDVCVPLAWVDWYIYTDVCVYILYVLGVKMSEGV